MTWMLIACSIWFCNPTEPLYIGITLKQCTNLISTMKVEGVFYKCEEMT